MWPFRQPHSIAVCVLKRVLEAVPCKGISFDFVFQNTEGKSSNFSQKFSMPLLLVPVSAGDYRDSVS
jgi:hypothetical protein